MENNQGMIRISDRVIAEIAIKSAKDVDGVIDIPNNIFENAKGFVSNKRTVRGIVIASKDNAFDLTIPVVLRFGTQILNVCSEIQKNVTEELTDMTGLIVRDVHVTVAGIASGVQKSAKKNAEKAK